MNPSHSPDLERCKKLTSVGFPETQMLIWEYNGKIKIGEFSETNDNFCCPSVSDLLDEIPSIIYDEDNNEFYPEFWKNGCHYIGTEGVLKVIHVDTIPNALADMYIWLKENNYLPK